MYNVNLDVFQGPLDLLLHLIEKMEIDIYNIPIAKLTESYLDYINNNDEFSLENAEEYIVMAATLIHIKSKSLLPVFNDDEQDIVEDDLVQQLIEYKNYKENPYTTLNEMYLKEGNLNVVSLGRGMAWLDTGTHDALLEASNFVKTIQSRQGIMVACLEEIAYRNGWIDKEKIKELAQPLIKSSYGKYLLSII